MSAPCISYCEHGGVCVLDAGHEGLHDSGHCQWDDAHALTREQADAVLSETPYGRAYVEAFGLIETALQERLS